MKHMEKFTALVCCSLAAASLFADPATGWKQTAGGTYDYNTAENWVNGEINGIFGSDLTLAGAQTIKFAADTSLTNGLTINYKGNFPMTFQSDGSGAKTLTLGGDISEALQGNASAVVTIGGAGDDALILDLGGENRTITAAATVSDIGKSGILSIPAKIQNGALTINGTKNLKLAGANTYAGGTTIAGNTYVYVNSETAFGTGDVSINAVLSLCADNHLTMTANNKFYANSRFAYRSGKTLDIGTGDLVATNSFQFWAEGDKLVIHGRIVDKDGNIAPWKLQKWGGNRLDTYCNADMSDGGKFVIGNGEWYFNGAISGTGFAIDASAATGGTQHFRLQSANTFQGTLSITGGSLYVYAGDAGAIPNGSQVSIGAGTYFIGNGQENYVSSLLANNFVTKDSAGTFCLNSKDTGDIDLTAYTNLVLGSKGGNRTYSGTVTWPDVNPIRIGGGGDPITFSGENAIPSDRDVEVLGKVIFTAVNDVNGTITIHPNGLVILDGEAATLPNANVIVHGGSFQINSSSGTGKRRTGTVHLHGGFLQYSGNGKTSTYDTIDKLIVDVRDPQYGIIGGVCHLKLYANGKTAKLHVGEFVRNNDMVWRMTGNAASNRLRIGGADGDNTVQFTVGNSAEILGQLVGGGGGAGTTTISIYPFGFADCSTYYDSLLTYGSTGFRALDYETEYATSITPGTTSYDNVRIPVGTTAAIASDATVNSLFLQGSDPNKGGTAIEGSGTLTLSSGVLVMGYHRNNRPDVKSPVNFGSRQGVVCYARGKGSYWSGAIHGTAGAIFFQTSESAVSGSGGTGIKIEGGTVADSTITGNIVAHGNVEINTAGVMPGGSERIGDIYANAYCNFKVGTYNGIFGIGYFYRSGETLTIGARNGDCDFDGAVIGSTTLVKIGEGRQRIGGISEHTGATTVSAGTLQVDGAFTQSAVTVAEGATLAGCGTFGKTVTLAGGAKLEVGSAKLGESDAEMTFENGITFQGDSAVTFKVLGKTSVATLVGAPSIADGKKLTISLDSKNLKGGEYCLFRSDSALSIAYSRGANCGPLSLRNDGKELWMRKNTSLIITLR